MAEKKVVILTKEQGILIRHQAFSPDSYFNPFLSKFMEIMISQEEVDAYQGEEFSWIKDLEIVTIKDTDKERDSSVSDLKIDENPVLYKIEDYVAKTVTIAYQYPEGRKEIVQKISGGANQMGYQVDLVSSINSMKK